MLLEIAIGDAYGRPFEFNTREFINNWNKTSFGYCNRVEEQEMTPIGKYTDDTQMSLAIAYYMNSLTFPFLPVSLYYLHSFINQYAQDPRAGYSKRIKNLLEESVKVDAHKELISLTYGPRFLGDVAQNSNGVVMRSIPLGLLSDPKDVITHTIAQGIATHIHLDSINASCAIALTAHYIYHNQPLNCKKEETAKFHEFLKLHLGNETVNKILNRYKATTEEGVQCDAYETASWVIMLAWNYKKLELNILESAISVGGDTDSLGALVLGLISLNEDFDVKTKYPKLYENLENGHFGREDLEEADKMLFEAYPRNTKQLTDEKIH